MINIVICYSSFAHIIRCFQCGNRSAEGDVLIIQGDRLSELRGSL